MDQAKNNTELQNDLIQKSTFYISICELTTDFFHEYRKLIAVINLAVFPISCIVTISFLIYFQSLITYVVVPFLNSLTIISFYLSIMALIKKQESADIFFKEFLQNLYLIKFRLSRNDISNTDLEDINSTLTDYINRMENNKFQTEDWITIIANQTLLKVTNKKCSECNQSFSKITYTIKIAKKRAKEISKDKDGELYCYKCGQSIIKGVKND